jgi:putative tryptophan/tyrosine transport system substrate-binding protein
MRRREFISLLGGASAWPLSVHAQQSTMPVIGYLDSQSPGAFANEVLRSFRQGLKEIGYVEGENVVIEYRWAENQVDRLPKLATELIRQRIAVIVAGRHACELASRAAVYDEQLRPARHCAPALAPLR